jgi:hypothetical protein
MALEQHSLKLFLPTVLSFFQARTLLGCQVDLVTGTFTLNSTSSPGGTRIHATGHCAAIPSLPSLASTSSRSLVTAAASALSWHPQLCSPGQKHAPQATAFAAHPSDSVCSAFLVHHPAAVDASFQLGAVADQVPSSPNHPAAPLKIPSAVGCYMPLSAPLAAPSHPLYGSTLVARTSSAQKQKSSSSSMDSRLLPWLAVSGVL